jgi:hypothetical protein
VRKGDLAPGTVGATFVQAFTSSMSQACGMNAQGRIHFHGALTGGDVVGTLNQAGIWAGQPGALELVARRGTLAPGLNGEEVAANSLRFGAVGLMNESGAYLYQLTLSTTSGSPAGDERDGHRADAARAGRRQHRDRARRRSGPGHLERRLARDADACRRRSGSRP